MLRHRLSEIQLRLRTAIGFKAGFVRIDLLQPHREPEPGVADRPRDPDLVARPNPASRRRPRRGRFPDRGQPEGARRRSEEHTSELQSLMRISYAVFCLKKKNTPDRSPTQSYDSLLYH